MPWLLLAAGAAALTGCGRHSFADCGDTLSCGDPPVAGAAGARAESRDTEAGSGPAAAAGSAGTDGAGDRATAGSSPTGGGEQGDAGAAGARSTPGAGGSDGAGEGATTTPLALGGVSAAADSEPAGAPAGVASGTGTAGSGRATPEVSGGGAAGAANEPPRLPCSPEGALDCAGAAQRTARVCHGGYWEVRTVCDALERCDSRSGVCAPMADGCEKLEPGAGFCTDDTLGTCGPDLVTRVDEPCAGRCVETADGAACATPACGDERLHDGEQCDDGNVASGDGCSSDCRVEPVALALGSFHTCALGANGAVKCWGTNDHGELGLGDREHRGDGPGELGEALPAVDLGAGRRAEAIAAGGYHTCALLDDGSVKCWGANPYGQLGQGDTAPRGVAPGEMGDALAPVDLGVGRHAIAIAAGGDTTCALLDVGTVRCWGKNDFGQCGVGSTEALGDAPGELGEALPVVDLPESPVALSVGKTHVCALSAPGEVYCWGGNGSGQLGLGDRDDRGDARGELADLPPVELGVGHLARAVFASTAEFAYGVDSGPFSCALGDDGALRCWGYVENLQPGAGSVGGEPGQMVGGALMLPTPGGAVAASVGNLHVCTLDTDGAVRCWGPSEHLVGGHGPVAAGEAPTAVPLGTNRRALELASGGVHSCARLDDGTVKCWGDNGFGQLGLGDVTDRGSTLAGLGDALPAVSLTF